VYHQQPGFESLIPQSLLNYQTSLSFPYSSSNDIASFTGQSTSTAHCNFANQKPTTSTKSVSHVNCKYHFLCSTIVIILFFYSSLYNLFEHERTKNRNKWKK
jgi:hypothetical protein